MINGLCLQCNNTQGDAESRLRELKPRDPKLVSCRSGVVVDVANKLNSLIVVVAGVVQEWKGIGKVEVHRAYEIFLPRDVYAAREAYR